LNDETGQPFVPLLLQSNDQSNIGFHPQRGVSNWWSHADASIRAAVAHRRPSRKSISLA
jgi:hypothetical protein